MGGSTQRTGDIIISKKIIVTFYIMMFTRPLTASWVDT